MSQLTPQETTLYRFAELLGKINSSSEENGSDNTEDNTEVQYLFKSMKPLCFGRMGDH
jgi:hypothetical protein